MNFLLDFMNRKICMTCGKFFENNSDEQPKNRICERCKEYIRKNNGITCKCGVCETHFEDDVALQRHMTSSHLTHRVNKCSKCEKLFLIAVGVSPFEASTCKWCDGFTHEAMSYFYRMLDKGGTFEYYCGICHVKGTSFKMVFEHLWTHAESLPYVCEVCRSGFLEYYRSFKEHMRDHFATHNAEMSDLGERGG